MTEAQRDQLQQALGHQLEQGPWSRYRRGYFACTDEQRQVLSRAVHARHPVLRLAFDDTTATGSVTEETTMKETSPSAWLAAGS